MYLKIYNKTEFFSRILVLKATGPIRVVLLRGIERSGLEGTHNFKLHELIISDLSDEVGGVEELAAADCLVGALAAGEGLASGGGDGLALPRQPIDLHVDVCVGRSDNHEWESVRVCWVFGGIYRKRGKWIGSDT